MLRWSWTSTSLFCVLLYSAIGQSREWRSDGSGFEYYASNFTVRSYYEAEDACAKMGSFLALPSCDAAEKTVKSMIRGHQGKKFYIGLTADLCMTVSQRTLNHSKPLCVYLAIDRTHSLSHKLYACDATTQFLCQRREGSIVSGTKQNNTCCMSRRMGPDIQVSPTYTAKTMPPEAMEENVKFYFDLTSFLIGVAAPCPFLIMAVVKILCGTKCCNRGKKKRKNSVKLSVSSVTATSSGNRRSLDVSTTVEVQYDTAYDATYANCPEVGQFGVNGYHTDGYEVPTVAFRSGEYAEPVTYEEYDFTRSRVYPY